jgi:predicted O-methyltransferase YrrM
METITAYLNSKGFHIFEGYCQEEPKQIIDLMQILNDYNSNSINVMEIGFNAGHSAEVFLQNNKVFALTSFDLGMHDYIKTAKEYIDITFPTKHTLILGDSRITIPQFIESNKQTKFDILFIDGCHNYDIANADLNNCFHLAHENSIVILDDTIFTPKWETEYTIGPTQTWMEHLNQHLIIELNRKEYGRGKGMAWGNYEIN